ncbi:MAG: bla [Gammaproteobacteria bacterium]|nr:bla [Gammaproteobacteria bacterium]
MVVGDVLHKSANDSKLLQQKIAYKKEDLVFWSPITEKNINSGMTIDGLCAAAMTYSDNTAVNLVMKKLGGPAAVTAFARSVGDNNFRLVSFEPNLNSNPNNSNDTSTPKAMAKNLRNLALGNILTPSQKEKLVSWMKGNTAGDTRIRAGVTKEWIVADKTGSGDYGISNDIAIIFPKKCAPIVIAIYTVQNKKDIPRRDDIVASATNIIVNSFSQANSCIRKGK